MQGGVIISYGSDSSLNIVLLVMNLTETNKSKINFHNKIPVMLLWRLFVYFSTVVGKKVRARRLELCIQMLKFDA